MCIFCFPPLLCPPSSFSTMSSTTVVASSVTCSGVRSSARRAQRSGRACAPAAAALPESATPLAAGAGGRESVQLASKFGFEGVEVRLRNCAPRGCPSNAWREQAICSARARAAPWVKARHSVASEAPLSRTARARGRGSHARGAQSSSALGATTASRSLCTATLARRAAARLTQRTTEPVDALGRCLAALRARAVLAPLNASQPLTRAPRHRRRASSASSPSPSSGWAAWP